MESACGADWTAVWTAWSSSLLYMPIVSVVLASLANTRYMRFPHRVWSLEPYRDAIAQDLTWELQWISLKIASCVAIIAVALAIPGALAFARYRMARPPAYQKLLLAAGLLPAVGARAWRCSSP